MALGRRQRQQQQQQEAEQQHQQQELQQRQQREEAGGGLGGGSPAAGSSDISSSGGGGAGAGAPKHPIHPLLAITAPPGLVGSAVVDTTVDIDHRCRVPHGWQRCLNLKTGKIFYKDLFDREEGDDMSRNGKNPRLDLSLNLSAHRGSPSGVAGGSSSSNRNNTNNRNNNNNNNSNNNRGNHNSPRHRSSSSSSPSSPASPLSSCVSSEAEQEAEPTSMVLVGCPHCLMYVMLSEEDPRCPKCKSTVLLDFLNDPKNPGAASTRKTKKEN